VVGSSDICKVEDMFYYKNDWLIFTDDEVKYAKKSDCNIPLLFESTYHVLDTWDSNNTDINIYYTMLI